MPALRSFVLRGWERSPGARRRHSRLILCECSMLGMRRLVSRRWALRRLISSRTKSRRGWRCAAGHARSDRDGTQQAGLECRRATNALTTTVSLGVSAASSRIRRAQSGGRRSGNRGGTEARCREFR